MKNLLMGCAVAALVALSARSEARPSGSINLETYVAPRVAESIKTELGLASWYGGECQGNPTASGEIYDMNGLTAAHRSLPLGTKIKVTNLRNKRSLIVRINDRGPYIDNRFLDLSMAAAKKLGFMGAGLALVRAEIVSLPKGYISN
jgi:rare lipoprotein A